MKVPVTVLHFVWIFLAITTVVVFSLTHMQDTKAATTLRTIELRKHAFGVDSVVQGNTGGYLVRNVSLPLGEMFDTSDVKVVKTLDVTNQYDRYWYGKGVLAEIMITTPQAYKCDAWCQVIKNRDSVRRWAITTWNSSVCVYFAPCKDIVQLASGLVIGGSASFTTEVKDQLISNNLYHIMVVSGFQVGIIALLIEQLAWRLKVPIVPRFVIIISILIIYCYITGGEPPVLRSTLTVGISLGVLLMMGRRLGSVQALAYSSIVMLSLWPYLIFSSSFQLSIVASLGLLLSEHLFATYRVTAWWIKILITSCLTSLLVLPITSAFGSQVSLTALLANIIVLPSIPVVSLIALAGLLPIIGSVFSIAFGAISNLLLYLLDMLQSITNQFSLARSFGTFSLLESLLYWIAVGTTITLFILLANNPLTKRKKKESI
jgi:ComEC/Rec2-related protein